MAEQQWNHDESENAWIMREFSEIREALIFGCIDGFIRKHSGWRLPHVDVAVVRASYQEAFVMVVICAIVVLRELPR